MCIPLLLFVLMASLLCGSSLATNVTSLLSTALAGFQTDTVYYIVGAAASLLSSGPSTSSNASTTTATIDNLRTDLLSYVYAASSYQVRQASVQYRINSQVEGDSPEPM